MPAPHQQRQMTGPRIPGERDGPSHEEYRGAQGFGPTDPDPRRDPGLVDPGHSGYGFTCAWLTVEAQLTPRWGPTAPQLPAVLMEIQPEPLASAAPAATGPAQATAATPLATASATPLTTGTCLSIGQPSRCSSSPELSTHPEDNPLVRGAALQRKVEP